jgi:hypothetical protein
MKKAFLCGAASFFLISASSCLASPQTPEAKALSALAPKVVFLCGFAIDFHASPEIQASWKALEDPSLDTHNLIQLLKSPDPKIRSLAIFALDHKYDPRILPDIAPLLSDRAPSYPCPAAYAGPLPADKPETWPKEERTVGDLAWEVVGRYLNESGYSEFSDYWEAHKNRNYCVSWFALRLRRAWGPRNLDRSSIDLLRSEIAHLPPPDRQWTVLWLGTLPSPNKVVRPYTSDDLIRNAAELGHEAILQFLDGRIQSADPDLRAREDPVYRESFHALQTFVLKHSPQLLAETDRDFLLQEKFSRSVWYPVGAAQLDRKNASRILHTAYEGFNKQMDDYNRAVLVMALWNLEGDRETGFILDWFYTASTGHGLYATPRHMFLRDAEEQENTRTLISAVIRDPRFERLEWNSLDDLVWMIRGWIGRDFVGSDLENREKSDDPRIRDAALAECRRRIRESIPQWLHSAPSP